MKDSVRSFLDRHGILPESVDMSSVCSAFCREMKAGLRGEGGSLAMIPAYCSPDFTIEKGRSVIVIDAGGTNLRTCLVSFGDDGSPVISDFKKAKMPGVDRQVTADEFFDVFASEVERLIDKSDRIGFCFSYAARILPNHDGIPIMFSKEVKAPEVIGKHIGSSLLNALAKKGHDVSGKSIFICNDTVSTLLAGLSKDRGKYDGCIGFILGTGTNTAYIQSCADIKKEDFGSCRYQIINMESGNMDICIGDIDKAFCDATECPEKYHFEKMISGAYARSLGRAIISRAFDEKLFSDSFDIKSPSFIDFTAADIDNFLSGRMSLIDDFCKNDDDRETLQDILYSQIERAAKLAACNLASAVLATDFGKERPVLINADGTTFYKAYRLAENVKRYLDEYLKANGRSAEFTCIDNSPIIGCAIGALSI